MTRNAMTGLCLTAMLGLGASAGWGLSPALAQTEPDNPGIAIPNITGSNMTGPNVTGAEMKR